MDEKLTSDTQRTSDPRYCRHGEKINDPCADCRREEESADARLLVAEQVLQAVEAWREKYKPRSGESCWQMDNCVINAPELVEECMTIAGYYKDGDDE